MPKKNKRHDEVASESFSQIMETTQHSHSPPLVPSSYKETLDAIRAKAQDTRRETSQVIAELEAWRAEIDATIAILKGRT